MPTGIYCDGALYDFSGKFSLMLVYKLVLFYTHSIVEALASLRQPSSFALISLHDHKVAIVINITHMIMHCVFVTFNVFETFPYGNMLR